MTSAERLIIEILAAVALIGGFALWEQHKGAQKCLAADSAAVAKQDTHNQVKAATDAERINEEAKDYAKTLADPAPADSPHVQLCKYTPISLPKAAAPRPIPDAAPQGRAADPVSARDVGPPLVKIGVDADAQVRGLQDFITRVCLVR